MPWQNLLFSHMWTLKGPWSYCVSFCSATRLWSLQWIWEKCLSCHFTERGCTWRAYWETFIQNLCHESCQRYSVIRQSFLGINNNASFDVMMQNTIKLVNMCLALFCHHIHYIMTLEFPNWIQGPFQVVEGRKIIFN